MSSAWFQLPVHNAAPPSLHGVRKGSGFRGHHTELLTAVRGLDTRAFLVSDSTYLLIHLGNFFESVDAFPPVGYDAARPHLPRQRCSDRRARRALAPATRDLAAPGVFFHPHDHQPV